MQKWDTFLILGGAALLLLGGADWMAARRRSGPPTRPLSIVAVGDSLTAAGGYCKELQRVLPAGSSVRCLGAPGEGVAKFLPLAGEGRLVGADYVIVLGGVNDLASGRSLEHIKQHLSKIYSTAHQYGAEVIAVTLTPWGGHYKGKKLNWETQELNKWIIYQAPVEYVVDSQGLGDETGYLQSQYGAGDGLHLSPAGQTALGQMIYNQVWMGA